LPYAEDKNRPTDTVYGYVPLIVLVAVLLKHGGIVINSSEDSEKEISI
jgi:hypothetical protein